MASSKHVVLITGANQGIGLEITKKLATENPDYHILMGSRSLSKCEAAIATLPAGLPVESIELDVTSDASISKASSKVQEKHGRLDVLINNAGISKRTLPENLTLRQRYTQIIDTNAISAACVTDAFVPLLRKSSNPCVIFMTSELGSIAMTMDPSFRFYGLDNPEYKASKAAMNMIMASYAVKYKDEPFKFNVCCPGLNATGLSGGKGTHPSVGAVNACRLATAGKDGESGTYTNKDRTLPW